MPYLMPERLSAEGQWGCAAADKMSAVARAVLKEGVRHPAAAVPVKVTTNHYRPTYALQAASLFKRLMTNGEG